MKTTKLLIGALSLLTLAACSDDKEAVMEAPGGTQPAKIRINIVSNNAAVPVASGRAGETYVDGDESESEIANITLVFYDAMKNIMGSPVNLAGSQIVDGGLQGTTTDNVTVLKTLEAEVSLSNGRYPSYMMVYANPVKSSQLSFNLSNISAQKRTSFKGNNGKFAMNNSVYFSGGNNNTDNTGTLQREVAVGPDNFYLKTEDESSATAVTVYLERLAAKVTLLSGSGKPNEFETTQEGTLDGKKLTFNVTGWGLNATAKECYLTKRFDGWSKAEMNASFQTFQWNHSGNYRSYWAMTPFYGLPEDNKDDETDNLLFPWVSDQVKPQNTFNYVSYNDIVKADNEKGAAIGGSLYTMENTVNSAFYSTNDLNKNAALISAVVTGYYTIEGQENPVDFYVYGTKIYLEADYLKAMAKNGAVIVKKNEDGSTTPLVDADNNLAEGVVLSDLFEIKHPETPIGTDAAKGVEENKVTIAFKNTSTNRNNFMYKAGAAEPVAITSTNVYDINQDLQTNCGLASKYKEGKAYFYVPIRHLATAPTGNQTWAPGSFGVVRNHSYVITVDGFADLSFKTLGKGIREPEDPIVPPSDPNDKFGIKANINVLAWRVVSQNVTLGNKVL